MLKRFGLVAGIKGFAVGAILALTPIANAEVVANLGTLNIGQSATTGCTDLACTASTGTFGGSLPSSGAFTHQIIFQVSVTANSINSAQILNRAFFDIDDVTLTLYELSGAEPAIGGTATPVGGALAIATFQDFGDSRNYLLSAGSLDPAKAYYLELKGNDGGVTNNSASYTTQTSISAVPLPPALFLLAAALAGLVGFSRVRRNRATA